MRLHAWTFYESGQVFGGVDVVVDTEIVAGYDLDAVRVRTDPCAGTDVTICSSGHFPPDRCVEPHRVALPAVVRRSDRGPLGLLCDESSYDVTADSRLVHDGHHGASRAELREHGESHSQRRPHALRPVVIHDYDSIGQLRARSHLLCTGAEYDDDRRAAAVSEHSRRSIDEELAADLHERLGKAEPLALPRGEQQPGTLRHEHGVMRG